MSDGDAMERARKLVQEAADSPVVVKARGAVLEATSVPAERTRLLQPLVPLAPEPATSGKNPVDTGWDPFQNALRVDAANSLPDAILPGLAWAERLALLSAPAKAGKSTFISQALEAAATERNFCGLPLVDRVPESVGIITEEPLGLLAQRLRFYGGPDGRGEHVERVWVASPRWDDERILAALERQQPDLVIIDSWTDWAVAAGSETLWNAAEMRLRMLAMREVADRGAAVLIVHHAQVGRHRPGLGRSDGGCGHGDGVQPHQRDGHGWASVPAKLLRPAAGGIPGPVADGRAGAGLRPGCSAVSADGWRGGAAWAWVLWSRRTKNPGRVVSASVPRMGRLRPGRSLGALWPCLRSVP